MDAMHPIDPVESLYDPHPAPPRISQCKQMPRPGKNENRICWLG
jgi:hypothetical protein